MKIWPVSNQKLLWVGGLTSCHGNPHPIYHSHRGWFFLVEKGLRRSEITSSSLELSHLDLMKIGILMNQKYHIWMFPKIRENPQNGWFISWKTLLKWMICSFFPIIFGLTPIYFTILENNWNQGTFHTWPRITSSLEGVVSIWMWV